MATVGEFCNRRVIVAQKDEPVLEAARRMRDHHVGSIVVVSEEDGKTIPAGMLTDRDIVVGVLAASAQYIDRLFVGDVMTSEPVLAREDEDLVDALKKMRSSGVRRMPVIDDDGRLVGLVSFDDLIEYLSEQMNDLAALLAREQQREKTRRA